MTDLFEWTPPEGYPNAPGWKEETTSRDAAKAMGIMACRMRDDVLTLYRAAWPAGMTADEVADLRAVALRWRRLGPEVMSDHDQADGMALIADAANLAKILDRIDPARLAQHGRKLAKDGLLFLL